MDTLWRIEMLGELRAVSADRVLTRFRTRKAGALLSYLAYYPDRAHTRDLLADLLWPDEAPEAARMKLRAALSSLRRQLEPPGVTAGSVVIGSRLAVRLNPTTVTTDVARFEAAVQAATRAGDYDGQERQLEGALDLYRGPLLPDSHEAWVLPEQQRLSALFYQALRRLIAHQEQRGQIGSAIDTASRAVAADPLREEAHDELIRLFAAAGQPAAALRQYRELEQLLREQCGEEPSPQTRQLVDRIRSEMNAAPGRADAIPSPASVRTNGSTRPDPLISPSHEAIIDSRTFLLVQIDRLGEAEPRRAAASHPVVASGTARLRQEFQQHEGREVQAALGAGCTPDSGVWVVAFATVRTALAAAVAGQRAVTRWLEPRGASGAFTVRMALHTGDALVKNELYQGPSLSHAAGLLATALGGQILVSALTAGLLREDAGGGAGGGPELRDLGVRHLVGMVTPERVFRVDDRTWCPGEHSTSADLDGAASLPLPVNPFFGRLEELTRLRALLLEEKARLVTLTGAGGSGKTRLALQMARELREAHEGGGPWFVPLADVTDAMWIADAIRDAMRLARSPTQPALEQVVQALRDRSAVLVLDNLEHLSDDGTAVIRELLVRAPSLQCLATSRRLLGLAGEREVPVLPLETPAVADSPERVMRFAAVQLFVDRVQAVRPDFQVTRANVPAVAEICHRLEGIPLALELAAAHARLLSPTAMVRQLSRRLDFLAGRRRAVASRHQSVRAALEWSYQLLTPELQRFFNGLYPFRGGFTPEAAKVVCEEPQAGCFLEELRQSSLVLVDETGPEPRYRMLETVREFAAELLTPDEQRLAAERHAGCFLDLAERAAPELDGADGAAWLDRLEREHDNLRAALDWQREPGRIVEGMRLGAALYRFWEISTHWTEGQQRLADLLARADSSDRGDTYARVVDGAARLAWRRQDLVVSQRLFEESLALQRGQNDRHGMAKTLFMLGHLVGDQQADMQRVELLYQESQALFQEVGDLDGVAGTYYALGLIANSKGDLATARTLWEERLVRVRIEQDRRAMADALEPLIKLAYKVGDFPGACDYLEERLSVCREMARAEGLEMTTGGPEIVTAAPRDGRAVSRILEECLAAEEELGFAWRPWHAWRRLYLAGMLVEQGEYARACSVLEECLAVFTELSQKDHAARVLLELGLIARLQNRYPEAKEALEESLARYREIECWRAIPDVLIALGDLASDQGDYQPACLLLEESLTLAPTQHCRAVALHSLGVLARRQGAVARARPSLEESLRLFRELGGQSEIALALASLGQGHLTAGQWAAAGPLLAESLELRMQRADRLGVAECLEGLAAMEVRASARASRNLDRAAQLFGGAAALREALGAPLPPVERPHHERDVAAARAALGTTAFAAAWSAGRAYPIEQWGASVTLEGGATNADH